MTNYNLTFREMQEVRKTIRNWQDCINYKDMFKTTYSSLGLFRRGIINLDVGDPLKQASKKKNYTFAIFLAVSL